MERTRSSNQDDNRSPCINWKNLSWWRPTTSSPANESLRGSRGPEAGVRGIPSPFIRFDERGRDTPHPGLPPLLPRKDFLEEILDVEAFTAPAFALGLRVLEFECLVQPLFDEIHQRSVDQRQAQGIHHHFHPARFETRVPRTNFVSIIHDVRESRTTGFLDAHP